MEIITQAIQEMKEEQGDSFSLETINLAELERRTGVSRARLRKLKKDNFELLPHGSKGRKADYTVLSGFTSVMDNLLKLGVVNSSVHFDQLQALGYTGGLTTVKNYIAEHKDLVPPKRQQVDPQGNRGRRYTTDPGEAFQMDWGFTWVTDPEGNEYKVACFAMICHHCGKMYIEFFPNARQENLFIGMIHAFYMLGVPKYILTDNMKSVVIKRDLEGHPIWQVDYEAFMKTVGFKTKLCKPRHPFTKGKVERLIRFVKDNFLAARLFWNISDLNEQALMWCNRHNARYHKVIDDIPDYLHMSKCCNVAPPLREDPEILLYLCPQRKISFDGFICYEGRRFGVPYSYTGSTARICRRQDMLYIYSSDLKVLLTTHDVTWSRRDSYCVGQYAESDMPEELPTAPVKTRIQMITEPERNSGFEKFDFDEEVIL
jgi:transposase